MALDSVSEAVRTQETGHSQVRQKSSQPPLSSSEKQEAQHRGGTRSPSARGLLLAFETPPIPSKPGLRAHSFTRLSTLKLLNFALTTS